MTSRLLAVVGMGGLALFSANVAFADAKVRGFATMGYSILTNKSNNEYIGVTRKGTMDRDSKLGLNVAADFADPDWSFAAQLVAKGTDVFGRTEIGYVPVADWYFLTYKPMNGLAIRVGRQPLSYSLFAEEQDVGYALPWVRLPFEMSSLINAKSMRGVQVRYNRAVGPFDFEAAAYGGRDKAGEGVYPVDYVVANHDRSAALMNEIPQPTETDLVATSARMDYPGIYGGYLRGTWNDLDIYARYTQFNKVTLASSTYASVFQYKMYGASVRYDRNGFLAIGEWVRVKAEEDKPTTMDLGMFASNLAGVTMSFETAGEFTSYYGTLGYQYGVFTPVFTYSVAQAKLTTKNTYVTPYTMTIPPAPMPVTLKEAGHTWDTTFDRGQSSITVGLNTALMQNAVWKVEYQKTTNNSKKVYGSLGGGLKPDTSAGLFSTSFDVVF